MEAKSAVDRYNQFVRAAGSGDRPGAVAAGLELLPSVLDLPADGVFGFLVNMAALNCALHKELQSGPRSIDVHLLRGHLYYEYAAYWLNEYGWQMRDRERATAHLGHEAPMRTSVGLFVWSAFKAPDQQAPAQKALGELSVDERVRLLPYINDLLAQ